jgi:hypothetical protein
MRDGAINFMYSALWLVYSSGEFVLYSYKTTELPPLERIQRHEYPASKQKEMAKKRRCS